MSGNDQEITLNVATPNGLFTGIFRKTAKVIEVIKAIITAKGLDASDDFDLVHNGQALKPEERPLVSFGLTGTVRLDLVAVGSGVCADADTP